MKDEDTVAILAAILDLKETVTTLHEMHLKQMEETKK